MLGQVAALGAAVLLVGAVLGAGFVLGMRTKSRLVLAPIIWASRRFMNPRQMRTAGTPGAYAGIIRHVGRVSGRPYETPIGIVAAGDAFLVALPYGLRANWLRNVLAAGSATIVVEGQTHLVDRPELVPMAAVERHFSPSDQRSFRVLGTDQALRVRKADEEEAAVQLAAAG